MVSNLSFILPALNEEKFIGNAIDDINQICLNNSIDVEIIVVDSDSEDRTAEIAKSKINTIVINQPEKGYGNALKTGFQIAGNEIIGFADPDGTYDFKEIPLYLSYFDNGYDFINTNRLIKKNRKSFRLANYVGNIIISLVCRLLIDWKAKDVLSGYKFIRSKFLQRMKLKTAQWDLNVEMTLKARLMRLNMIVVDANYFTRSGDDSKLERIDAGWQNIKYLLLYRMDRIFIYVSLVIILFTVIFNYIYLTNFNVTSNSFLFFLLNGTLLIAASQALFSGLIAKQVINEYYFSSQSKVSSLLDIVSVENTSILSLALIIPSIIMLTFVLMEWLGNNHSLSNYHALLGIFGLMTLIFSIVIAASGLIIYLVKKKAHNF